MPHTVDRNGNFQVFLATRSVFPWGLAEGRKVVSSPSFGIIYSRLHEIIAPAEFARRVETLGYDSVWATEGLVNQAPALDPIITMAELAHGSERIDVGSCVILSPLRNPAVLAKEIATLDFLSAGRIVLGLAVGGSSLSNPADYSVTGIDPRERAARCDEGIEIMKKLWTGERISHRGKFYRFDDIYMHPRPVQKPHPRIWVGGNADGAVRRAGRFGDGFVPIGEGAESYKKLWAKLCESAHMADRDPSGITPAVHLFYSMAENRRSAHAIVEKTLTERYGFKVTIEDDRRFLLGNADDCAEAIESYLAVGVTQFVINTVRPLAEVCTDVERFAELVLPHFR